MLLSGVAPPSVQTAAHLWHSSVDTNYSESMILKVVRGEEREAQVLPTPQ